MLRLALLALLASGGVLEHHGGPSRDGLYVDAAFSRSGARGLHRDASFDGRIAGEVYAQPLLLPGKAGGRDLLVVATEENAVYGLDARTGHVLWRRQLGTPVPLAMLSCGNIDPLGITGTPVASADGSTIYLDALTTPDGGHTNRHLVFALAADDGTTRPGWPVDVAGALAAIGQRFNAADQNQRSALALANGTLFVAYGGHYGDCGDYRGWVVGLPVTDPRRLEAWATPAAGGGIWGPSGPAVDGNSVFVTTGNTMNAEKFSCGEALMRLTLEAKGGTEGMGGQDLALHAADFFAPANWKELDDRDLDLGGAGPLLFTLPGLPGSQPQRLVAAFGKDGNVYVLDRTRLGGIGGQLASLHAVENQGGIRTAATAYPNGAGVTLVVNGQGAHCPAGQSGDLTAVQVNPGPPPSLTPTLAVAWCADSHGGKPPGGSPITTSPDGRSDFVIWNVGAEGDERLHGFDGETGAVVFAGGGPNDRMKKVQHFQTPLVANGRIYVAGEGRVYAFTPGRPAASPAK
jgi:outer membrane protein assembly factor BamB